MVHEHGFDLSVDPDSESDWNRDFGIGIDREAFGQSRSEFDFVSGKGSFELPWGGVEKAY